LSRISFQENGRKNGERLDEKNRKEYNRSFGWLESSLRAILPGRCNQSKQSGEYFHEGNRIDQKTLRELQNCEAQRHLVCHLQQPQAQAATRVGEEWLVLKALTSRATSALKLA
jgi:hypothetical protein